MYNFVKNCKNKIPKWCLNFFFAIVKYVCSRFIFWLQPKTKRKHCKNRKMHISLVFKVFLVKDSLKVLSLIKVWVLSEFEFLSFFSRFEFFFKDLSQFEFFHNLSFVSGWVFEFCHNLSFWVLSQFEFYHNFYFSFYDLSFWVLSRLEFLSFFTIWVLEFCHSLSFWVVPQFEFFAFGHNLIFFSFVTFGFF